MRRRDKIVVWPVYIDSSKTRREGRRIPVSLGIGSSKLSELVEAAEKLGLEPEPIHEAAHPRTWWNKTGYLLVKKKMRRRELLAKLSSMIAEIRLRHKEVHPKKKGRRK